MRQVVLRTGEFHTEEEAIALAEAEGLVPLAFDLEPSGVDHWHDFAAKVFVVDGAVRITDVDSGSVFELTPGCSIQADPGAVHREEGAPYRAVVAFACDPATLTMPIDKSPAERSA